MDDFPGDGLLIRAANGWFLARTEGGAITVAPAGKPDTGDVLVTHGLPGGGVLIRAEKGWFVARAERGTVTIAPAGNPDTEDVLVMRDLPGGGVLIGTEKGLFVTAPSLADAEVDIRDRKNVDGGPINREVTIAFLMAHGCAPVANQLGPEDQRDAPGREAARQQLAIY
jgi:hypothetical protein